MYSKKLIGLYNWIYIVNLKGTILKFYQLTKKVLFYNTDILAYII